MHKLDLLCGIALLGLVGCADLQKYSGSPGDISVGGPAPTVPPVHKRSLADGSAVWEYNNQPWGDQCFLVTIDPQGRVVSNVNGYSDENLARIKPGMTMDEVQAVMCQKLSSTFFELKGEEVWTWNIQNPGPGTGTRLNVHFRVGLVFYTSTVVVFPDVNG